MFDLSKLNLDAILAALPSLLLLGLSGRELYELYRKALEEASDDQVTPTHWVTLHKIEEEMQKPIDERMKTA